MRSSLSSLFSSHSYYPLSRNLTKTSFLHGTRNYTPRRLSAAFFCRCIFAATVTGPNVRSSRISLTLVPERGSSRSSWTWQGTRSRSTSVGRDSSASAWHGRDQVKFEGSPLRLRSPVSRELSILSLSLSRLLSFLAILYPLSSLDSLWMFSLPTRRKDFLSLIAVMTMSLVSTVHEMF